MNRCAALLISASALSGLLLVVLGATGAHVLADGATADQMIWFGKAWRYHAIHTLAMLATGIIALHYPTALVRLAGWLFPAGILLFSGSLYVMAFGATNSFGLVTPLGGACFMAGWLILTIAPLRARNSAGRC